MMYASYTIALQTHPSDIHQYVIKKVIWQTRKTILLDHCDITIIIKFLILNIFQQYHYPHQLWQPLFYKFILPLENIGIFCKPSLSFICYRTRQKCWQPSPVTNWMMLNPPREDKTSKDTWLILRYSLPNISQVKKFV